MRYDRDDDMIITGKRHDFRIEYDAGFDYEGQLLGVDFTQMTRCGWAMDLSLPVADRAMLHADNAYYLPTARITSHRLKTNTQSATAFRGFGGPQGVLGIERVMDQIAATLNLDPAHVRQRNYYAQMNGAGLSAPRAVRAQDGISEQKKLGTGKPYSAAFSPHKAQQTTPYGMPITDFILHDMTEALLESSDYHGRRAAIASENTGGVIGSSSPTISKTGQVMRCNASRKSIRPCSPCGPLK